MQLIGCAGITLNIFKKFCNTLLYRLNHIPSVETKLDFKPLNKC